MTDLANMDFHLTEIGRSTSASSYGEGASIVFPRRHRWRCSRAYPDAGFIDVPRTALFADGATMDRIRTRASTQNHVTICNARDNVRSIATELPESRRVMLCDADASDSRAASETRCIEFDVEAVLEHRRHTLSGRH